MIMIKKGYNVSLTYDITDLEKAQAEKALLAFDYTLKLLRLSSDHLNIMLIPFKDHPEIPEKEIVKYRAALRRFRDKAIENLNNFKRYSFQCISLIQMFSTDTQTSKLIKSFISSVEDIEKLVNRFSGLFDKLDSKDFVTEIVKEAEQIQKEIEQLEDLIDSRIKTHIQTNILGKTWVDNVSDELQINVENKTPLIIELNKKRQEELNHLNKG
jgi:hypothetical protein